MAIRARWKGGGDPAASDYEFHHGIPARNLDEAEYAALDAEQRETVRKSPLYDYVPERAAHASAASKGGEK